MKEEIQLKAELFDLREKIDILERQRASLVNAYNRKIQKLKKIKGENNDVSGSNQKSPVSSP